MLACGICGRPLSTCCDIYDTYEDENGQEVTVCGECIAKHGLEERSKDNDNQADM